MLYKIKYGSLEYDPDITEEIFKDLIICAEAQGLKFNKHFSGGGETYEYFKKNKYLNFDPISKRYQYGKCYIIDNNSQGMPKITLDDLKTTELIINNYQIY